MMNSAFNTVNHKTLLSRLKGYKGSCLGLLLFLVYINDIYSSTEINMRLFADDACLSYQHSDPACVNSVINEELRKVGVWLRANKLFINYSKTKFLLFNNTSKKN